MIFIGPLPPPIHGMSAMNHFFLNHLVDYGIAVTTINTAPKSLKRDFFGKVYRFIKIIITYPKLIFLLWIKEHIVYISLSGGWGVIYDFLSTCIARFFGSSVIFHHHTYAFLIKKKWLFSLLFKVAGKNSLHISLCERMALDLKRKYNVDNTIIMSNIASMPLITAGRTRRRINKIGFIGNITIEKGFSILIQLAHEISKAKLPIELILAGPCAQSRIEMNLKQAVSENIIQWLGPVYDSEKTKFFKSIDILLMPTQYQNEAEPLVIWEAFGHGVPVISYNRGCISTQLISNTGCLIDKNKNFVHETMAILNEWLTRPDNFSLASETTLNHYKQKIEKKEKVWTEFLRKIGQSYI